MTSQPTPEIKHKAQEETQKASSANKLHHSPAEETEAHNMNDALIKATKQVEQEARAEANRRAAKAAKDGVGVHTGNTQNHSETPRANIQAILDEIFGKPDEWTLSTPFEQVKKVTAGLATAMGSELHFHHAINENFTHDDKVTAVKEFLNEFADKYSYTFDDKNGHVFSDKTGGAYAVTPHSVAYVGEKEFGAAEAKAMVEDFVANDYSMQNADTLYFGDKTSRKQKKLLIAAIENFNNNNDLGFTLNYEGQPKDKAPKHKATVKPDDLTTAEVDNDTKTTPAYTADDWGEFTSRMVREYGSVESETEQKIEALTDWPPCNGKGESPYAQHHSNAFNYINQKLADSYFANNPIDDIQSLDSTGHTPIVINADMKDQPKAEHGNDTTPPLDMKPFQENAPTDDASADMDLSRDWTKETQALEAEVIAHCKKNGLPADFDLSTNKEDSIGAKRVAGNEIDYKVIPANNHATTTGKFTDSAEGQNASGRTPDSELPILTNVVKRGDPDIIAEGRARQNGRPPSQSNP